jgi:MFS family permease
MTDLPKQKLYYGWVVVSVSFVTMAIVSPAWFSFPLFYPPILEEFGWTRGATAGAFSLNLLISAIVSPLVGLLIDRFGPRVVMPIGALLFALGLFGSSRVHALWHLYVWLGVVSAVGFAAVQIVPNTAIISNWFTRNRATALGIVAAGVGVGRLVFFPLIQKFISSLGWRGAYVVMAGVLAIVVGPLIFFFQRHKPAEKGLQDHPEVSSAPAGASAGKARRNLVVVDQEWAAKEWDLKKAMKTTRFWALTILVAIYSGGLFMIIVQAVAYLTASGFSSIQAATAIGAHGVMSTAGNFAGGLLADRIGREKSVTLSIALIMIGIFSLSLIQGHPSNWLLYSYVLFFGSGLGLSFPTIMVSSADIFQGKHFGAIFGAINLGSGLGGAVGAALGGFLFDLTKSYRPMFWVTLSGMALSAIFIWIARPGRVRMVAKAQEVVEVTA